MEIRKYTETFTWQVSDQFINHNLGTKDIIIQVYNVATDEPVSMGIKLVDHLSITIEGGTPDRKDYRVVILG